VASEWEKKTFYRRSLPEYSCIAFSSPEGRTLFAETMRLGTAESFFKLIEQFHTQDEPAYCGLASLTMALNALAIDPRRPWKGPWRWFNEDLLDCCEPLPKVRP
jgi:glutathione gamma-glutamylcysteinyltransferase